MPTVQKEAEQTIQDLVSTITGHLARLEDNTSADPSGDIEYIKERLKELEWAIEDRG